MNRSARDYCSNGIHPRWRSWTAKYDMSSTRWELKGCFCDYCGARVDGVGSGAPDAAGMRRLAMMRRTAVDYVAYDRYVDGLRKIADKIGELQRKLIAKKVIRK